MHSFLRAACAALLLTAVASPALAAESPWSGTWKFDPAKSTLTGSTFTYSTNPDGSLHFTNGSTINYNFSCNGKDFPVVADRTVSCTKSGESTYDFTWKAAGKEISTDAVVISSDGKTITDTEKGTRPDGSTYSNVYTSNRISGTAGLAGEWKDSKVAVAPATMVIEVTGNTLHLTYPASKATVTAKLDGADAPYTGPQIPAGVTLAYKPDGAQKLDETMKLNGKPWSLGTMTISPDGKTITSVTWSAGKPNEKTTRVWEKQ